MPSLRVKASSTIRMVRPSVRTCRSGHSLGRDRRSVGALEVDASCIGCAAQLVFGPAEHRGRGRVHVGHEPVGVQGVEALGHVVHDHGAELLGFLALGDVDHDVADADDLAVDAHRVVAGEPVAYALRLSRHSAC